MVKNHYLRAKTNLKVLFRRFRGLITQNCTLSTRFCTLITRFLRSSEPKYGFEAESFKQLRGTIIHYRFDIDTVLGCTPLELEKDISYTQATGKEDAA